jgi:hypothetical protein
VRRLCGARVLVQDDERATLAFTAPGETS